MVPFSLSSRKKISIVEFPNSLAAFIEKNKKEFQKLKRKQEELEKEFVQELNKSHYDTSRQVIERKKDLLGEMLDVEIVIEYLEIIQLNMEELVETISNSPQKEAKFLSFVNDIFDQKKIQSFPIRNLILKKLSKILEKDLEIKYSERDIISKQEEAVLNDLSRDSIKKDGKTDEIDKIIAEVKDRMKKE